MWASHVAWLIWQLMVAAAVAVLMRHVNAMLTMDYWLDLIYADAHDDHVHVQEV
jgi:hypothetical protein